MYPRTTAHIFVSPGDATATITQCVPWMERQFNACQTPRSMYLSIFNSVRVIRCLSQCVSPKIAIFTTFLFPLGTPLAQSRNILYGWKENSMLTNCLPECAHLTITVSQIERDNGWKSSFSHSPLAFDAPVKGVPNFPSEHRHPVWYGKTMMAWLSEGEKNSNISLFVLAQLTNVTDGRTPSDGIYRAYAYASRGKNCLLLAENI